MIAALTRACLYAARQLSHAELDGFLQRQFQDEGGLLRAKTFSMPVGNVSAAAVRVPWMVTEPRAALAMGRTSIRGVCIPSLQRARSSGAVLDGMPVSAHMRRTDSRPKMRLELRLASASVPEAISRIGVRLATRLHGYSGTPPRNRFT